MLEMERVLRGQQRYTHGKVYTFECPSCAKSFSYDAPGEPLCDGPSESRKEHPPVLMRLVRVVNLEKNEKNVPGFVAVQRAAGPLYVPGRMSP